MDEKAVNEILMASANTFRQAEKLYGQAEVMHAMVKGSCPATRAVDMLFERRFVIWHYGSSAWQVVLAFLNGDQNKDAGRFDPLLRKHELLHEVCVAPETFGPLRKSFFSESKARTAAMQPYAELKRGYAVAGEHALQLIGPFYRDACDLLGMRHRLEMALEALPQPLNPKPVNSPPVNRTQMREGGGAGSVGISN